MPDFREALRQGEVLLFDGAMGTELYRRGVFINRCYDDLSRTEPEMIREVHRSYREAGARVLETNSFGANRYQLQAYGLEEEAAEIARSAAALAREVAGDDLFVAGSLGPLGVRLEPYGPTARDEARAAFREQAEALAEGGADLLVCETFSDLNELCEAVAGCREATDLPVLAQATVQPDGETSYGDRPAEVARRLEETGAEAMGLNCSVGPAGMVEAIREMAGATELPVSAMPNAGLPREVQGRKMYLASPDYMAGYTRKLVEAGARLVGGCCGTTPEHTGRMADQLRAISPRQVEVRDRTDGPEDREESESGRDPIPLAERSGLGRKLASGETVLTAELPPPRGSDTGEFLAAGRRLRALGADAALVSDAPRATVRMDVVAAASLLQREAELEAVAEYTCRDRNLLAMGADLLGAQAMGVRNLLLVTGDPPKTGPYAESTAVFDVDAIGLANLVGRLNRGLDVGGHPLGSRTSFVAGVSVDPGSGDRERELERWYWKVDAGAEFAVTGPVFDLGMVGEFLEELEERGTRIPVVAGVWPLTGLREAEYLAHEVPGVHVPSEIRDAMERSEAEGPEAAAEQGRAVARRLVEGLSDLVEGVHVVAPGGRVEPVLELLSTL